MADGTPTDPAAMFRQMLGQWEAMANKVGGEFMKSGEFAQAMHAANTARMSTQAQIDELMAKALAAANLPSRADIEALSARLGRIEDALARIEAGGTRTASETAPAEPKRTRKPPKKDKA